MRAFLRAVRPTTFRGWFAALFVLGAFVGLQVWGAHRIVVNHEISAHHLREAGVVQIVDQHKGGTDLTVLLTDRQQEVTVPEDGDHHKGDAVVLEVSTKDPSHARLEGTDAGHAGKVLFVVEACFVLVLALIALPLWLTGRSGDEPGLAPGMGD